MRTPPAAHRIGTDEHLVRFEDPGPPVPDGEGGYTETWTPLDPPTWYVRVRPATAKDAERVLAGTVITHLSHLVHGRFHPGVTTRTRMIFDGATYLVTSVENLELRGREMTIVADLQA
jgi:head-tail adaptor